MDSHPTHFAVGKCSIVSVEHPSIIKNVDKAIGTLGGAAAISQMVRPKDGARDLHLSLRQDDVMSNSIVSANVSTDNLLLKIKIPRLTGRKRKLGSHQPFQEADDLKISSKLPASKPDCLFNRLAKVPARCEISIVGNVEQTHRFRALLDYSSSRSKQLFVQELGDKPFSMDLEHAKGLALGLREDAKDRSELLSLPRYSYYTMPFNYHFMQNPAIRHDVNEAGEIVMRNDHLGQRIQTDRLPFNVEKTPERPGNGVPREESLDPQMKSLIQRIGRLFDERPIWTRRAILNEIEGDDWKNIIKYAFQHVGYTFRSGPWRDAIIKYGIDPRTDPKYRMYQTMMFQFDEEVRTAKASEKFLGENKDPGRGNFKSADRTANKSHKFDGASVSLDGKLWQVCDITEPLLQSILNTENIRQTCHIKTDGWYHNGTWAKARVIAKAKMMAIKLDRQASDDVNYDRLAAMPDVIDRGVEEDAYVSRKTSSMAEMELAATIRSMARGEGRYVEEDAVDIEEAVHAGEASGEAQLDSESSESSRNGDSDSDEGDQGLADGE